MQVDIARHINAVVREVGSRIHEGKLARVVLAQRDYDTDIDDLWNALTTAERIPRWFMPITGELRLGGRFQLQGNAEGTITHCEPPRLLKTTWECAGDISWVSVTLAAKGDATRLQLEHIAHVDDARWAEYGPGAVGAGWDLSLLGLALHIETGFATTPDKGAAFMASDDGKAYTRASSDGWRRASIASGTPEKEADAAAARTTAAYLGEPRPSSD